MLSLILFLFTVAPVLIVALIVRYLTTNPSYQAYALLVEPTFWLTTGWWIFSFIRRGGR